MRAANLVAMIIRATRYNYVRNAQNDIVGLIDSTGKRVVYYKYDSWGRTVSISGTMAVTVGQKNPFRYVLLRYRERDVLSAEQVL